MLYSKQQIEENTWKQLSSKGLFIFDNVGKPFGSQV
jgi:hypothetical protein